MRKTIIAPASYGAFQYKLAKGSEAVFSLALQIACYDEDSFVVWGAARYVCGDMVEKSLKENALAGVENVYIGEIASTIDEAEKSRDLLFNADEIILIAEKTHLRRAKYVWQKNFPNAVIRTVAVRTSDVVEKDHPVILLRSKLAWRVTNFVWCLIFRFGGYRFLKSVRHPISSD